MSQILLSGQSFSGLELGPGEADCVAGMTLYSKPNTLWLGLEWEQGNKAEDSEYPLEAAMMAGPAEGLGRCTVGMGH